MVPEPPWSNSTDKNERLIIVWIIKGVAILLTVLLDILMFQAIHNNFPAWLDYLVIIFPMLMIFFMFDSNKSPRRFWSRWLIIFPLVIILILMFWRALVVDLNISLMLTFICSLFWFKVYERIQ